MVYTSTKLVINRIVQCFTFRIMNVFFHPSSSELLFKVEIDFARGLVKVVADRE